MAKRRAPRAQEASPVSPAATEAVLPTLPPAPQLPEIEASAMAAAAPPPAEPVAPVGKTDADPVEPPRPLPPLERAAPLAATSEPSRPRPLIRLAAGLAGAAALGALAGSLGSAGLDHLVAAAPQPQPAQEQNLTAELRRELAALKASIDTLNRATMTQFGKVSERIDSVSKAQAEPNARIAKLTESLERLERRNAALTPAAATTPISPDITGSVPTRAAAAAPVLPPVPKLEDRIVSGWVLRDMHRGRAVVESRHGLYEVSPGANLPGLGPVETIRRQDGRWVVVTPKGLIVSSR